MTYTPSQLKAITESKQNILVSAGAGSGKTGVLKERVIQHLTNGVHIDELIILTFTNAAAFEMKSRIKEALDHKPTLKEEQTRINQAIISTFDAFCLRLVKQYHYLLDVPKTITIGDAITLKQLQVEVTDEIIKEQYLMNDASFESFVLGLFHKGDQLIYDAVSSLSNKLQKQPKPLSFIETFDTRYWTEEHIEQMFAKFEAYLKQKVSRIKDNLKQYKTELSGYDQPNILRYLDDLSAQLTPLLSANDYDGLAAVIKQITVPRKPSIRDDEVLKGILTKYHKPLKDRISELDTIVTELHANTKQKAIEALYQTKPFIDILLGLAKESIKRQNQYKKERNLYHYSDIFEMAITLLEEHPEIANQFKTEIYEIMIDEYQDTNDIQEYFISLISNDNVFTVGDMKQSIYGFRDANPYHFLHKYTEYKQTAAGLAIDLRENFRSRRQIIQDINDTFHQTMSEQIGGINYQEQQSLIYGLTEYEKEANKQTYGIEVIHYDYKLAKEEDPTLTKTLLEAKHLANDITTRIKTQHQIYDLSTKEFRTITYQDIAILIDRATDFEMISTYLSQQGIPVNLYSDEPFLGSPEMLFLTSFLKLVHCFIDEEYLQQQFKTVFYSVARSFVYQIPDEQVIHFIIEENMDSKATLHHLKEHESFAKIYDAANYISTLVNKLPMSQIIRLIYQTCDIYPALQYLSNPEKKEQKLDYFAMSIARFPYFTFADLIAYLERIEEHSDWDIEYAHMKSNQDAVKLMTMHKSKGLQFPVVYILGLGKQFNFQENRDFFIFDEQYGLISQVLNDGYYPNFLRYLYLNEAKRKYISERIRLLYVAFTRAKEHLILLADDSQVKSIDTFVDSTGYIPIETRMKYHRYLDLLSTTSILQKTHHYQEVMDFDDGYEVKPPTSNKTITIKQFVFDPKAISRQQFSKTGDKLLSDDSKEAMTYGEQVHQQLEQFDFYDLESSLKRLKDNRLRQSILKLMSSEILDLSKHPNIYQEWEFYEERENQTIHGIIDLLVEYVDAFYIVDYKLKRLDDSAYLVQLLGYLNYLKTKTNKEVHCYLYSILDGTIRRIA